MSKPKAQRRVNETESMAMGRVIRTGARKLNLLAQMIRGKKVSTALADLSFSKRRIAQEVKKVLQSAVANAENNHQLDIDRLVVAQASVGRTFVMKRFHARGKGGSASIEKPFSRLTIVVREAQDQSAGENA